MADETLLPTSNEKTTVRTRSPFDTTALNRLALAVSVGVAARRPECVAPLSEREFPPAVINTFCTDTEALQATFARVVSLHALSQTDTQTEKAARTTLVNLTGEFQTAALQKWTGNALHQPDRAAYGIGQSVRRLARPALETVVRTILQRAAADTLPGITPTKIDALRAALAAWIQADNDQSNHVTDAAQLLAEAKAALIALTDRRIKIQLAADAAFPHHNPENAAIRTAFSLPTTRAFRPVRR